jgi:hypothetical protein
MFEPVATAFTATPEKSKETRWEVNYVLLLWLAHLALVPFDIISENSEKRQELVSNLITKSTILLSSPAKDGESASFFLSRLMLRRDMLHQRDTFLDIAFSTMSTAKERLITGYLRCVFHMLTSYDREWARPYASRLINSVAQLSQSPSAHHQLYRLKCIQQLALALLPPRVAAWRYLRGKRILRIGDHTVQNTPIVQDCVEDFDVPEEVNDILSALFEQLNNSLSVVRWSAAKGVGRIVERLPLILANEAIEYLFSLFSNKDDYNLINGVCLCLGEFTLRGCLPLDTISRAIPFLLNALVYDVLLGTLSTVEGIRDSGCFVCWALARSYAAEIKLANSLVNVFLFDRSVNVRRSASAAFQENVGRHGQFPRGLELIHVADFLSVSSRVGCYTRIAPFVAQFEEYGESIVEHLVGNRIEHWDPEIRVLAANSLSIIAKVKPELITAEIVRKIAENCASFDLDVKHGGLEALAGLLWVMDVDIEVIRELLVLPETCQSDGIKAAFVKMVSAAAKRGMEVPNLAKVILEWLLCDSEAIRAATIESLTYLCSGDSPKLDVEFFDDLLSRIQSPGIAASLRALPSSYLESHIDRIIASMRELLSKESSIIATKCNLLESLQRLSQFCEQNQVIEMLLIGLNDCTTTKRGDEGSTVRTMALKVTSSMLPSDGIGRAVVCDVLKLCLDRISGIRDLAMSVLAKVVETTAEFPHRDELLFIRSENFSDFENFANLMGIEEFGIAICERFVLCVGAYAPDLSQRSGNAIIRFMERKEGNVSVVTSLLTRLFRKFRTDVTFTQALFSFVPKILNSALLHGEVLTAFAADFLEITAAFLRKIFYRKLISVSPTLSGFTVICSGDNRKRAFSLLAPLFVCEFPVVREKAATDLNNAFEEAKFCNEEEEEQGSLDSVVQRILSETAWKEDFAACAEATRNLCRLFGVDVPVIEGREAVPQRRTFTYGNLVKDSL